MKYYVIHTIAIITYTFALTLCSHNILQHYNYHNLHHVTIALTLAITNIINSCMYQTITNIHATTNKNHIHLHFMQT